MSSAIGGQPFVSGPRRVDEVHPEMGTALGTLWTAVSRAGGAVGFLTGTPEAEIRDRAEAVIDEVRADREQLLVIGANHALAGTVFLRRGTGPQRVHRAEIVRLMVHPDLQGRGWGRILLDAAVAEATAVGLEQLLLSVRGGTELPKFYAGQGWTEVGVWPGALRFGADDRHDEHWFQLRLGGRQGSRASVARPSGSSAVRE